MAAVLKAYRELRAGDQVRDERDGRPMRFVNCTDVLWDGGLRYRFEREDGTTLDRYQHPVEWVLVIGRA